MKRKNNECTNTIAFTLLTFTNGKRTYIVELIYWIDREVCIKRGHKQTKTQKYVYIYIYIYVKTALIDNEFVDSSRLRRQLFLIE